jgi:ferredoxin
MISSLVGSVEGKTFFLCGPEQMYILCEEALKTLGTPSRRVKKEVYGPPADVTSEPGWPGISPDTEFEVTDEKSGRTLKAKAGEPLMISLERSGIVVPALCRSGECTTCRTRLVSGKVFAPARVHRRWSDEKSGYIHPCMSYPMENLRIRL